MDNSQPNNENNSKKTPPCINTEEEQDHELHVRITRTGPPPHTDKGLTSDEEAGREHWLIFEAWRVGILNNDPE